MTKLELVAALWDEAGLPGNAPSTTIGQTGEYSQVVQWIDQAYNDILISSRYWLFMRGDVTLPMVIGTSTYAASAASITDLSEWENVEDWRVYKTSTADEQFLIYVPWEEFRLTYLFQGSRTQTEKPQFFSIKPSRELIFYPIPNYAYTALGEYRKRLTAMDEDTDSPVFPVEYHMAVVWKALTKFAGFHSEPDKYVHGSNEFNTLMTGMRQTQTPKFSLGATLA